MQTTSFTIPPCSTVNATAMVTALKSMRQPACGAVRHLLLETLPLGFRRYIVAYTQDNQLSFLYTALLADHDGHTEFMNCWYFGPEQDFGYGDVDPFRKDQDVRAHGFKPLDAVSQQVLELALKALKIAPEIQTA